MKKQREKIFRLKNFKNEHKFRNVTLINEIINLRANAIALKKQIQNFMKQKKSQIFINDSNHEKSFKRNRSFQFVILSRETNFKKYTNNFDIRFNEIFKNIFFFIVLTKILKAFIHRIIVMIVTKIKIINFVKKLNKFDDSYELNDSYFFHDHYDRCDDKKRKSRKNSKYENVFIFKKNQKYCQKKREKLKTLTH